VAGLGLYDAWNSEHTRRGYTYYASMSASCLDRIYVTRNLLDRKQGIEVVAIAFTDHFAVVIRLTTDVSIPERGRSYWKMNVSLLSATDFRDDLQERRTTWREHDRFYTNPVTWWTRHVKEQIRKYFVCKGATRRQDRAKLENFYEYYAAIYDAVRDTSHARTTHIALKALKAKIVRLHNEKSTQLLLGVDDQDKHVNDPPAIYQILKQRKRQTSRLILNTPSRHILRKFVDMMKSKYNDIQVDPGYVHSLLRGI
jgi:hypothetical protein